MNHWIDEAQQWFVRWTDNLDHWIDDAEAWLESHIQTVELIAVWTLSASFAILAIVKLVSWYTLRHQSDQTEVGKWLRRQKAAECFAWSAMCGYWTILLVAYYTDYRFSIWERYGVITAIVVCVAFAALFGVRFVDALQSEDFGRPFRKEG